MEKLFLLGDSISMNYGRFLPHFPEEYHTDAFRLLHLDQAALNEVFLPMKNELYSLAKEWGI